MTCQRCGLPDNYRGQGDGIGSGDCPRCQCCGRGPDECDCSQDWDERWPSGEFDDEDEPDDFLCNDSACLWRARRVARRAAAIAHRSVPHRYVAEADFATCGLCHAERNHAAHLAADQPEGSDR